MLFGVGGGLALCVLERRRDVAQRSIEVLIGRLITDEAFRSAFGSDAIATITEFVESGQELTPLEISALRATPVEVWEWVADRIDPRLQKVSLGPITRG